MSIVNKQKAWIPHTVKHVIPNIDHGPLAEINFVVVHIMQGTLRGTFSWWENPNHEADGAHVCVSKDGRAYQTASLHTKCWHAGAANSESIGFEHEGISGESHSHVQLHASANRVAWIHHEYGLGRPRVNSTIFPHSHGGARWGGHPLCPGKWDWDLYESLCHTAYMEHWGR